MRERSVTVSSPGLPQGPEKESLFLLVVIFSPFPEIKCHPLGRRDTFLTACFLLP